MKDGPYGFRDAGEFRTVVGGFFERVRTDPDSVLAGSGLVLVFRISDLGLTLTLDASRPPNPPQMFDVRIEDGTPVALGACVYELTSETLDRVCQGALPIIVAVVTGQVRIRAGNHFAVVRVTDRAIRRIIPAYRQWRRAGNSAGPSLRGDSN
ncbi:MAG: hypothetical protein JO192_05730 [Candidatus Eremiobacteraeota bacterium]|nr:hypothetical protein [Candidatus Eremiobacteraeota bacterium]